jgi:hypothetical protein
MQIPRRADIYWEIERKIKSEKKILPQKLPLIFTLD